MSYITISGDLSENTTWTSGTYFIASDINIGDYSLTMDLLSGNIVYKTAGNKSIIADSSGNFTTINSGYGNKIIFTSINDDAHGEIIAGSTASPVAGDQSVPYYKTTYKPARIYLDGCEAWYWGSNTGAVFSWGDQPIPGTTLSTVTLKNAAIKYSTIASGTANTPCFIGFYKRLSIDTVSLENVVIDDTNSMEVSDTNSMVIRFPKSNSWTMQNVALYPTGYCHSLLDFRSATSGSHTANWDNIYVKYTGDGPSGNGPLYLSTLEGGDSTLTINNMLLDGNDKSNSGINIIINTDSDAALGSNDQTLNPNLGSLLYGTIVNSSGIMPTTIATRSMYYDKQGSDTFNNLGIDETIYTFNGSQYAGTDNITAGVYYTVDSFIAVNSFMVKKINPLLIKLSGLR